VAAAVVEARQFDAQLTAEVEARARAASNAPASRTARAKRP
jgi:hypothetical protein